MSLATLYSSALRPRAVYFQRTKKITRQIYAGLCAAKEVMRIYCGVRIIRAAPEKVDIVDVPDTCCTVQDFKMAPPRRILQVSLGHMRFIRVRSRRWRRRAKVVKETAQHQSAPLTELDAMAAGNTTRKCLVGNR